ncbi:lysine decarboxylase [Natranaerovirga pectinivora]|uniref:Lysine decarboxylase n=1 Tax=Natranaerovirga pectinivora TaxID=682400 RepID=A0A4R3MH43_9FIRM|nr:aminotransferase class I/II-fold pyridoxal phosphate-dependent enzyme [Natranaerovirga pectinivora]TCT11687.1 lysine decarboxylase [Natranaerovirga pectinivora]
MKTPIFTALKKHTEKNSVSFHMPGHKNSNYIKKELIDFDLTEIDGLDNLHGPIDIIEKSQKNAARVYNTFKTYYLINGSTVGILSSILGLTNKGDKILIARNCHKSVYNAIIMNELEPIYIYPELVTEYGISGGLNSKDIEKTLIDNPDIKLAVITSPSYEGVVLDVKGISKITKNHKIPLIVDEAHGSHLRFNEYFPSSALEDGADVVIHSLHKTMPSLTQTALLHINNEVLDFSRIKLYLSMLQTSSPSYILMASMDYCIGLLDKEGYTLYNKFVEELKDFRDKLNYNLKNMVLIDDTIVDRYSIKAIDKSKIVLNLRNTQHTGQDIEVYLREEHNIQMELSNRDNTIGITTFSNSKEDLNKLYNGLMEIDNRLKKNKKSADILNTVILEKQLNPYEVNGKKVASTEFIYSNGYISAEFIIPYPPGIPLIVPGELISKELIEIVLEYKKLGISMIGTADKDLETIKVIKGA